MADFIGIEISGLDEIKAKLIRLPVAVQDAAVEESDIYILNIMRAYQPYKHIFRSRAFPNLRFTTPRGKVKVGYSSWAQFKLVHAMASRGELPYKRTQTLSRGWKTYGSGRNQMVANETPYAAYVMGKGEQDRLHQKMGWITMEDRIQNNMAQIIRKFEAGVKKGIKKAGF